MTRLFLFYENCTRRVLVRGLGQRPTADRKTSDQCYNYVIFLRVSNIGCWAKKSKKAVETHQIANVIGYSPSASGTLVFTVFGYRSDWALPKLSGSPILTRDLLNRTFAVIDYNDATFLYRRPE